PESERRKKYQNNFNSTFLMKICPEDDANSESCIKSIEDFQTRIKMNLNLNLNFEVVFGGMTKPKIIIFKRFEISKHQILNAEKDIR
ncbi:hypothetical protein, partial [Acinetobacter johnsonii]|uniref:hypothetical protein n=1 Tax=Acinetobacter johnsonii TaxID=40214 RepID=UPI002447F45D